MEALRTIYIDVLIFVNMFVNYFILLATEKVCKQKVSFWRRVAGDAVASASSLIILLPDMGILLTILTRVLISAVVVLASFGFSNFKRFITLVGGFYSVSFAYAGICFALWLAVKPDGLVINNDAVYFNISPLLLMVTSLVSYGILILCRKFFGKEDTSLNYQIEITVNNKTVKTTALLDSGNKLYDAFSNTPVVIAEFSQIKSIVSESETKYLMNKNYADPGATSLSGYRLIPYSVIGGKGLLPAFRADRVIIIKGKKQYDISKCLIAVSEDLGGSFGAIINKDLIEGGSEVERETVAIYK